MKKIKTRSLQKTKISVKRKILNLFYKIKLLFKILCAVILLLFFFTNIFDPLKKLSQETFYSFTSEYGLILENLTIEGDKNISTQEIVDILNTDYGASILSIDLNQLKQNLEEHQWVHKAVIERSLPSSLYIAIIEREPIAVWQFKKKLYLIDNDGVRIALYDHKYAGEFLQVIGEDANIYAYSLLEDLKQCPEISKKITSAIRYGGRRWNLNFSEGFTVKMPEVGFKQAYQRLCRFHKKSLFFGQNYLMIDLRDSKKMYFKKDT
ncbi:MAG: hypothetical protein DGJ47_000755 [Rickettsiaceae bacterium]